MSLRSFHLVFIALSVVLAAFFAAWAVNEFRAVQTLPDALFGILSVGSGVGLAFYGAAFQRKTRNL